MLVVLLLQNPISLNIMAGCDHNIKPTITRCNVTLYHLNWGWSTLTSFGRLHILWLLGVFLLLCYLSAEAVFLFVFSNWKVAEWAPVEKLAVKLQHWNERHLTLNPVKKIKEKRKKNVVSDKQLANHPKKILHETEAVTLSETGVSTTSKYPFFVLKVFTLPVPTEKNTARLFSV